MDIPDKLTPPRRLKLTENIINTAHRMLPIQKKYNHYPFINQLPKTNFTMMVKNYSDKKILSNYVFGVRLGSDSRLKTTVL